jgi:hypothetical protein
MRCLPRRINRPSNEDFGRARSSRLTGDRVWRACGEGHLTAVSGARAVSSDQFCAVAMTGDKRAQAMTARSLLADRLADTPSFTPDDLLTAEEVAALLRMTPAASSAVGLSARRKTA